MLKKSLFFGTFFLLFIGLSDYGYGCHRDADNNGEQDPHGPNGDCSGGDPEPDPEPNKGTPVVVTFDNSVTDSIQSDILGEYKHEESKTGVLAILDGGFFMNMRAGGVRKLFVNFGDIVDCDSGMPGDENDNPPFGDCVLDVIGPDSLLRSARPYVECPFPSGLRTTRDGQPTDSCSALVKAALWAHDAFLGDPPEVLAHIEDMDPGDPCPAAGCGGPVIKVRPFQDRDIEFNVPSPTRKKSNGWSIIFSDKKGHCSNAADDAGLSFPDFLSIRALDMVGDGIADTWHIGTFVEDEDNPAGGTNDPRLACLVKHKRDEFVGFFEMSFMYTVVILEPAP